jgi:hypothetical protein
MRLITLSLLAYFFTNEAYATLTPITRQGLIERENNSIEIQTQMYIDAEVKTIYDGVMSHALKGKRLYMKPFQALSLSLFAYPIESYVPKIMAELSRLFPDSTVELSPAHGYVIHWN